MTAEPLSFFTVDRGTASTAVSLIAPLDGRFRLLASATAPSGIEMEALLEDLVARVVATDPGCLPGAEGWPDWARLESATRPPIAVVCAAATERRLVDVEGAVAGSGAEIRGRFVAARGDLITLAELCLDPDVSAVVLGSGEPSEPDERQGMAILAALVGAMAARRDDLWVLLAGGAAEWAEGFPSARRLTTPAPARVASAGDSPLRAGALDLAAHIAEPAGAPSIPEGRAALRTSVETLARLLDRRVEVVDVGMGAGSRTLAHPTGVVGHMVSAEAALVPASVMRDDREAEAILRWSALRADPFTLTDRIRNLRLSPWRDAAGEGARLRFTVLRAALARLEAGWRLPTGDDGRVVSPAADLLIACGGAFAALPPPAAALAIVDTLRRPGALAIFHDHARVLGPVGTLVDESDRRRLLADLLDDVLLPLGSAIVAGDVRDARHPGRLRVTSALRRSEVELAPGGLRLLDLPPGVPARVEMDTREGTLLGTRSRHLAVDVMGGLGGLLVDTREVPLRLPDRAERRRALFEAWERPVWAAAQP